ncbi:hypothetical protein BH10PSE16_BH10PSE16_30420 [soil metagenome]
MNKYAFLVAAFSLAGMVSATHADTQDLAKEKQCFSCHAVASEMGKAPAFKSIARKYKGMANSEEYLAHKIEVGGVGHWGSAPMPGAGARPEVSNAEAKELVGWILAQH